jgi:hypothetical protein
MPQQPRRTGRPPKARTPGKRASLGLKVTDEIKERLDGAAKANGRTQSQEAETRLERSFRNEDLLPQLLDLAYGPETAGLLMVIGECVERATAHIGYSDMASLERGGGEWIERRWTYRQVKEAIETVLRALEPPSTGEPETPEAVLHIFRQEQSGLTGQFFAKNTLAALCAPDDAQGSFVRLMKPARNRLASVIERLRGKPDDR